MSPALTICLFGFFGSCLRVVRFSDTSNDGSSTSTSPVAQMSSSATTSTNQSSADVDAMRRVVQIAWPLVTDSLRSSLLCLQRDARVIAAAAIVLAAQLSDLLVASASAVVASASTTAAGDFSEIALARWYQIWFLFLFLLLLNFFKHLFFLKKRCDVWQLDSRLVLDVSKTIIIVFVSTFFCVEINICFARNNRRCAVQRRAIS